MVCKLDQQTIVSDVDSHGVSHASAMVPQLILAK